SSRNAGEQRENRAVTAEPRRKHDARKLRSSMRSAPSDSRLRPRDVGRRRSGIDQVPVAQASEVEPAVVLALEWTRRPSLSRRRGVRVYQLALFCIGVVLGTMMVVVSDLDRILLPIVKSAGAHLDSRARRAPPRPKRTELRSSSTTGPTIPTM